MTENPNQWQAEIAQYDRDRYMVALMAPPEKRAHVLALLAWNNELARVAGLTHEPMVGLIRQTWWREVLEEIYAGKPPRPQAVVQAMAAAIEQGKLPYQPFETLVSAREADLEKAPFATIAELETYAAETSGILLQQWSRLLGQGEAVRLEKLKHLGMAWGLLGTLRATHTLAHQNKLRLPTERLDAVGVKQDDVLLGKFTPELAQVVQEVVDAAHRHMQQSCGERGGVFALRVLATDYLKRIRKAGYNPFDPAIERGRASRALKLMFRR
ncbi:MAG: phytoene/squalene synthase family protein [Rickettsiales bacterium]